MAGIVNYFESDFVKERYKILTLDGKIDHVQVLKDDNNLKSEYQRWDVIMHKSIFKKAFYTLAKHHPEKFKILYQNLKEYDEEFFQIAEEVLKRIKTEYRFN